MYAQLKYSCIFVANIHGYIHRCVDNNLDMISSLRRYSHPTSSDTVYLIIPPVFNSPKDIRFIFKKRPFRRLSYWIICNLSPTEVSHSFKKNVPNSMIHSRSALFPLHMKVKIEIRKTHMLNLPQSYDVTCHQKRVSPSHPNVIFFPY